MKTKLKQKLNQLKLGNRHIYLASNISNMHSEATFLDNLALLLSTGIEIVELKADNSYSASIFLSIAKKVKELCAEFDSTFIVHDRADIAYIIEADGLNLSQDSIDVHSAHKVLGETSLIGINTNSIQQAIYAEKNGADYINFSPNYSNNRIAHNKDMTWIANNLHIPAFIFCGNNIDNYEETLHSGINKVIIEQSALTASDPVNTIKKFNEIITNYNK